MPVKLARQAKRGYLANPLVTPPLIYPFQYNPENLTDNKSVSWGKRESISPNTDSSSTSANGLRTAAERQARQFSNAEFLKFQSEENRTIGFSLTIDGREKRPGEPDNRRNKEGDILTDLAILRSFVYPKPKKIGGTLASPKKTSANTFVEQWFNEPPTALLVFGDLILEGYITSLDITEEIFNENLNPVRAKITIAMTEKVDSFHFVADSIKRINRLR